MLKVGINRLIWWGCRVREKKMGVGYRRLARLNIAQQISPARPCCWHCPVYRFDELGSGEPTTQEKEVTFMYISMSSDHIAV